MRKNRNSSESVTEPRPAGGDVSAWLRLHLFIVPDRGLGRFAKDK